MLVELRAQNDVASLYLAATDPPKKFVRALDSMCNMWNDSRRFRQFLRSQHSPGRAGRPGYVPLLSHHCFIPAGGRHIKFDLVIETKTGRFPLSFLEDLRHVLKVASQELANNPRRHAVDVFFSTWRRLGM